MADICIVSKRENDGKYVMIGYCEDGPIVAQILKLNSTYKVNGMPMFRVEAMQETNSAHALRIALKHNETYKSSLQFICPSCQGTRLECCEDGPYNSEVVNIDPEGDFDYGEINASGQVERFQCLHCGFIIKSDEPATEDWAIINVDAVARWIKENCKEKV